MPKVLNITSRKFFNQLKNGSDFGQNLSNFATSLQCTTGERIKAVIDFDIEWYANSDSANSWNLKATSLTRSYGSFINDGFQIGHTFDYLTDWTGAQTLQFNATIDSISFDGSSITFTVNSGSVTPATTETNAGIRATSADNELYAVDFAYNLLPAGSAFSAASAVTGNLQTFSADGVGAGSSPSRSTTPVSLNPEGAYSDWVSGSASVAFVSETAYIQSFQLVHEFIVTPFSQAYLRFVSNLEPIGWSSVLGYSLSIAAKADALSDTVVDFQQVQTGVVKWYNAALKGSSNYSIASIVYEETATADSVPSLLTSQRTTAIITVSKTGGFAAGQRAGLFLHRITKADSEYKNTVTTLEENFLFDELWHDEGAAADTGTGAIKVLNSSIVSGDLVLVAEIEYTLAEALKATEHNYLISIVVGDTSSNERMHLIADVGAYADRNVIPELCSFGSFQFFQHDATYPDGGKTALTAWNEDGLLVTVPFFLDLNKSAFLNSLKVKLSAYNTVENTYFELDSFTFSTYAATISGGVQQIEQEGSRGYVLGIGSQFNDASIEIGSNVGGIQEYLLRIGQKISWQDWVKNSAADTVFYDNSKLNSGLNDKSSNYSNLNNYEIRIVLEADVSGVNDIGAPVRGISEGVSGNISVNDYNLDGEPTPEYSAVIKTYDAVTNADLGGNISGENDTLFVVEWTDSAGAIATATAKFCIHRIELENDASYQINELSSINFNPRGNILKSIDSSGLVQLSLDSGKLISKCLIDVTRIDVNLSYNLSARLQK